MPHAMLLKRYLPVRSAARGGGEALDLVDLTSNAGEQLVPQDLAQPATSISSVTMPGMGGA